MGTGSRVPSPAMEGGWSPPTGAGGVIEAAALAHTPQQLKIARRKEINSRRSPARSHQPNRHRLCSRRSPSPSLSSKSARVRFPSPTAPGREGTGIDFTPMSPSCHPSQGMRCRQEGWMPPHPPVCATASWPGVPGPLFYARKELLQQGPLPVPGRMALSPRSAPAGTEVKLARLPAQPSLLTPLFQGFVWLLCEDGA